jgi:hypothetical protein
MTITVVRVRQTYTERVTEFFDVEVVHDADEHKYTICDRAKSFVTASEAIGKDIDWAEEKCERINTYSEKTEAVILADEKEFAEVEPAPVAPPTPQLEEVS